MQHLDAIKNQNPSVSITLSNVSELNLFFTTIKDLHRTLLVHVHRTKGLWMYHIDDADTFITYLELQSSNSHFQDPSAIEHRWCVDAAALIQALNNSMKLQAVVFNFYDTLPNHLVLELVRHPPRQPSETKSQRKRKRSDGPRITSHGGVYKFVNTLNFNSVIIPKVPEWTPHIGMVVSPHDAKTINQVIKEGASKNKNSMVDVVLSKEGNRGMVVISTDSQNGNKTVLPCNADLVNPRDQGVWVDEGTDAAAAAGRAGGAASLIAKYGKDEVRTKVPMKLFRIAAKCYGLNVGMVVMASTNRSLVVVYGLGSNTSGGNQVRGSITFVIPPSEDRQDTITIAQVQNDETWDEDDEPGDLEADESDEARSEVTYGDESE